MTFTLAYAGFALAVLYGLWLFYLAVMNLKRAKDAGTLTRVALFFGWPLLLAGLVLDLIANVLVATLIFADMPAELTVTARLKRYVREQPGSWRASMLRTSSVTCPCRHSYSYVGMDSPIGCDRYLNRPGLLCTPRATAYFEVFSGIGAAVFATIAAAIGDVGERTSMRCATGPLYWGIGSAAIASSAAISSRTGSMPSTSRL
jgi:hypothetical protein